MKILIYLTGGVHWLGGVQYTRNLLNAISSLPLAERPEIVIKIGRKNESLNFEQEFSHHQNIVVDGPVHANSEAVSHGIDLVRRALRRFTSVKLPGKILRSDECSVAFPVKGPNVHGNAQNVYWVPDFQYKHFPDFFSERERRERDEMYDKMFSEEGVLVLSSEAVKADFLLFYPKFKDKIVRILRFSSIIESNAFSLDAAEVCRKYNLPDKFLYVPNQFWQHKGFETAFEAVGLLRDQGLVLPLVSTGSKDDYRNSEYYQRLGTILNEHGIEDQITMLGMVPREDQVQIFRRAALVLQPSRFEGWSTSVEDARALGKQIIVSDIDVHVEQAPPHSSFFKAGDARDLADKIKAVWPDLNAGPDMQMEKHARAQAKKRTRQYALDFIAIMQEVGEQHWIAGLSQTEKKQEILKLAALHQLLPETLRSDAVGPRFSKLVRHRRELFHPVGEHTIRQVGSTTGLTFNVNLGDHLGCDLYYGMFNEQSEYELFNALVKPGDIVIDVGANIGLYSLLGARRTGPSGRVVAFEPDQRTLDLLRKNVEVNKLGDQVNIQPICVGSRNGMTSFNEAQQGSFSGIIDTGRASVANIREIPIRKLDDVLPEMGITKISFLKVDVEGTEAQVLLGAIDILEKSDAIIELEISTKNNNAAEIDEMLSCLTLLEDKLGYVAYCISSDLSGLVRFKTMGDVFEDGAVATRNNYFLVRKTYDKAALISNTFAKIQSFLLTPNRFFRSRFVGELSRNDLKALHWAERERAMLAIGRADNAFRRLGSLPK